ncbi:hypothetical protein ACLOJK_007650 [Asimina triloba]
MGEGNHQRDGIDKDDDGNRMVGSRILQSATGRRSIPHQQAERWEDDEEKKRDRSGREDEGIQGEGEGGRWEESEEEKGDWHRSAERKKGFKEKENDIEEKGYRRRSTGRRKGFKGAGGQRRGEQHEEGKRRVDNEARRDEQREASKGSTAR